MTAPTPPPPADRSGEPQPGRHSSVGLARWQKVVGIIGLVVVVVLSILLATGDHGPGRHAAGDSEQQPTNVEGAPGRNRSNQIH